MCRQTVWREMVAKERRKGNVHVESPGQEAYTWFDCIRTPLLLILSLAVFLVLLCELLLPFPSVAGYHVHASLFLAVTCL